MSHDVTNAIEFWFSIGSTYTYLTVSRLPEVEKETGASFVWRPFNVRELMLEMKNVPFIGKPVKEKYMWRDLQRRAQQYGLPVGKAPVAYPLENFDLANRVAIVAQQEGWCPEYVRAAYQLWFLEGLPAGDKPNLEKSLQSLDHDVDRVLTLAMSDRIERAYFDATSTARSLGIFGSPSFVVNGSELFWGDDRVMDAIAFSRRDHAFTGSMQAL